MDCSTGEQGTNTTLCWDHLLSPQPLAGPYAYVREKHSEGQPWTAATLSTRIALSMSDVMYSAAAPEAPGA